MCSCMSVPTGYGPDGTAADLISNAPVTKRDITFSVDFSADLGPDNWFDQEEIVLAIREQFEQSGLFRRVHYVLPQNASAYHYHFKVSHSGTPIATRTALGVLSGCTLLCLPVWVNSDLNWTMSCLVRGKEVYSASSQQTVTDYVWLPLAVTTPFMNHATMGGSIKTKPLQYFVREIRDRKLNDIQ